MSDARYNTIHHRTDSPEEPRLSFVMIVLNGMPFIEFSLRSVYDFAREIIIVEGAVENCMFAANPDGSSKDGTVEFIKSFPDPHNKIRLLQGKWPEKCEMQNEALRHVTGGYVWLIDSDEVYSGEDIRKITDILTDDPSITQVNFIPDNFWKGLDYIFVSPRFFEQPHHYRRLFKFVPGATFTTHRPPTMVWPGSDKTSEQMHLLDGKTTRQMGIIPYHYSYVLDEQVEQKIELYHRYGCGQNWNIDLHKWYEDCFLKWTPENRREIEAQYPIWTGDTNSHTLPFKGTHPEVMHDFRLNPTERPRPSEQQALSVIGSTQYQQRVIDAWSLIRIDDPVRARKDLMTRNIATGKPFWNIHVALAFLADRLRPEKYLEVGVRTGCSLVPVLHNSNVRRAVAMDLWSGNYGNLPNTLEFTKSQIAAYQTKTGRQCEIEFIRGDSHSRLKELIRAGRKFDLITIDGDHSEAGALEDMEDAVQLLDERGAIVFDDIVHPDCSHLMNVVDAIRSKYPHFQILSNTLQDNGCAIILKNIDAAELLNQKQPCSADSRTRSVRIAADYVSTGRAIDSQSSFGAKIRELFTETRPKKIIETGTYLGTGTTAIIARALQELQIKDALFYSIEVNPQYHARAKQFFQANNLKVNALNGLSVPRSMLPDANDIARRTITDVDYDGVFVDHNETDRVELYRKETDFPDVLDNLLHKTLAMFDFRPDFVLLDSGGHMGNIEFNYLIDNLKDECFIALDDIYHVKHARSFRQIKDDGRFSIVVCSDEKFGFCIAKFTPVPKPRPVENPTPVIAAAPDTKNSDNSDDSTPPQILLDKGHVVRALAKFEKILALSTDQPAPHLGRALCLVRLGRLLEAEVEAANALAKDPANPQLRQFTDQIRALKPNLKGDRDIEWGFVKRLLKQLAAARGPGAKLLDFGCGRTAELSRFAAQLGYKITAVDMMTLTAGGDSAPQIDFIQGDFLKQHWGLKTYDLIINCSSIEHAGLPGRYGVIEQGPDDDLNIMAQMAGLIKPTGKMLLTIPVGRDTTVGSLHRVYGPQRLALLLAGWDVQDSSFWIKDENNHWRQVDSESALQREPMLAYGIGCFVLHPVPVTTPTQADKAPSAHARIQTSTELMTPCPQVRLKTEVTREAGARGKLQKVLIVKTDGIGDFVIFSAALPYYRKLYPQAHIAIVVRECSTELAQACPYIDRVIVNHRKSMVYDREYAARFVKGIQDENFDIAVCPIYSRDKVTDFIMINSGAKERIASTGNESNMPLEQIKINNAHFTKLIPAKTGLMLEMQRNIEFLQGLGASAVPPYETTLWLEQQHTDFADALLREFDATQPIVVCPFAQYEIRNWPDHKWADLIAACREHPVLICGADRDAPAAERIIRLTNHPGVHNLCGRTSLRQMAALLARAGLCIGVESAAGHIAAAVGCPHVIIIGGGHFGRFMPYSPLTSLVCLPLDCYRCNWKCKYDTVHCIKDVHLETLVGAIKRTLEKSSQRPRIFMQDHTLCKGEERLPNWKTCEQFLDVANVEIITSPETSSDIAGHPRKPQSDDSEYLVSAIISTFNSQDHIRGCLEDLENQTIADRLEIIVVNSGSQQNEEAVVRQFQSRYDNIKYIRTQQRETIYNAWNRAIKESSGKYITTANTDDRHSHDALEKMAHALEANPDKVLVYANQLEISEADGQRIMVGERINGPFSRPRLFNGECPPGSQPMWRADVHKVLGYFDEAFAVSGDYEFWFRLTQKFDFLYLNEFLGERLIDPNAVSKANNDLLTWENMVIDKCYRFALQQQMTINAAAISDNPIFSNWPEVNIWRRKVKDKLHDTATPLTQNVKHRWDCRTAPATKLTVIIVTCSRHAQLLESLDSLNKQTQKDFEVIVVSNDGDLSDLEKKAQQFSFGLCGIQLEQNFGPSPARNIAIESARAPYIAFLDDDAIADRRLVENTLRHFETNDIAGLRGKVLPARAEASQDIPANYDLGENVITTACEVSSFSAYKKDVLAAVGCFDELLFGCEGLELSYRICKTLPQKVNSILYFPDIVVYHDHSPDGPEQIEKILRLQYMELLAWRKDHDLRGYRELVHSLYPGEYQLPAENAYAHLLNVAMYLQNHFPNEAVRWALQAEALNPGGVKAACVLGALYIRLGRHAEACAVFEKVLPMLENALSDAGRQLISPEFQGRVDISQCYLSVCTQLAQCCMKQRRYDKVKQIYGNLLNNPHLTILPEQQARIRAVMEKLDQTPASQSPVENKADASAVVGSQDGYLVSAIVSTYNAQEFLGGCLDDLQQQTIADRLEIIVVNSGSQQNEEAIVRRYQQKYDNIVYIKTEQREGIYSAWNRAVKVARGQFLTNANTDDRHRQDALEIMAKTLQANPEATLVYGDQIRTDTPNDTFANQHGTEMLRRPDYSRERLLLGCCVGSQPMWRKSLHDEFGCFDETLDCAGDWDFWIRISGNHEFQHIPEFLGLYYYNQDGIEHGSKIHSLYERYIVGRRYGAEYIAVIPYYKPKPSDPLVSVVMPVHNGAQYIGEAIESVLIQSYPRLELIIVDDGSTDATRDVVARFEDERIRYIYKENGGPSSARNLAIKEATGQYIMPLDADDMMTPDFIVKHLQQFQRHPEADLVYCDVLLIDSAGKPIKVMVKPEYQDRSHLAADLFRAGHPIIPFRLGIRKSVFDKIGLYDESLIVAEDYDMIRRFVKAGLNARHLPEPLHLRRMHPESLCRSTNYDKTRNHFDVIHRFIETFAPDELFPEVEWDKIPPEMRQLHAKSRAAVIILEIGKSYLRSDAMVYAQTAFARACSQLKECLSIDPDNHRIHQMLEKCELIRAKYQNNAPQGVCSLK